MEGVRFNRRQQKAMTKSNHTRLAHSRVTLSPSATLRINSAKGLKDRFFAALLRSKILRPLPPLDSSFRWNDENDTPVIPGKAAGRDPESRSRQLDSRLRGNDGQGRAPRFYLQA